MSVNGIRLYHYYCLIQWKFSITILLAIKLSVPVTIRNVSILHKNQDFLHLVTHVSEIGY